MPIDGEELESIVNNARLSIYFSSEQLKSFLIDEAAWGILLSPSLDQNQALAITAGRVDSFRGKIVEFEAGHESNPKQQEAIHFETPETKNALEDLLSNNQWLFRKAFFDGSAISPLIESSEGLWFHTTVISVGERKYFTLTAAPPMDASSNASNSGILSLLPCPPNCGGGGTYRNDEITVISV